MASLKQLKRIGWNVYNTFHGPNRRSDRRCSIMAWGQKGMGKSEAWAQLAAEMGAGFIDLRLSQMEPGDLFGLPVDKFPQATLERMWEEFAMENEGMSTEEAFRAFASELQREMTWTKPDWWPTEGKHIVLLDEFNRQTKLTLQASFQLILDGAVGIHTLPDQVMVVAAANPVTDDENYDVFELDDAAMDRFLHIKVRPTVEEWLQYAEMKDFHRDVIVHIGYNKEALGILEKDYELDIQPTPRSWEKVSHLLHTVPEDLEMEVLSGLLGPTIAAAFVADRRSNEKPIMPEQIIDDYDSKVVDYGGQMFSPKERVASYVGDAHNSRTDILAITNNMLIGYMHKLKKQLGDNEKGLTRQQGKNLSQYLLDLPADLMMGVAQELYPMQMCRIHIKKEKQLEKTLEEAQKNFHQLEGAKI